MDEKAEFKAWLKKVDRILLSTVGLSSGDMADFPSWDLFASGVDPKEAAYECLVEWNDMDADLAEEVLGIG